MHCHIIARPAHILLVRSALLAAHPEVQEEVAAELEAAGLLASRARPQPRRLTYADLSKLPNLDAVRPGSMTARDPNAVSVMFTLICRELI